MRCVQHTLLSSYCEPDPGASPTFFTAHAALGLQGHFSRQVMRPRPLLLAGLHRTSGSSEETLMQQATRQGGYRDTQAGDSWTDGKSAWNKAAQIAAGYWLTLPFHKQRKCQV